MRNTGINIKTGVDSKYYEIYEDRPYTKEDLKNDFDSNNASMLITDMYGIIQIAHIFIDDNGECIGLKLLYGGIARMGAVVSINEFIAYNPTLIKLKEVKDQPIKDGSDLNKMSNIFPFFRVYDYNIINEEEVKV